MANGTMTEEQFKALAERFLELSDHISDGWELITSEGGNTVYLKKRLKQTLNYIESSTPADHELIVDDPSLALPPENSNASNSDVYQFEYHVVYSVSYQVPILYFNAFKSDGTMLRLEDAWDGFRDLALESREQLRQTLTQMEHPVVFKPFLALHPCRTAQVLGDIATGCGNAIVAFLSSYGPFVNLHLDIRYGGLVK